MHPLCNPPKPTFLDSFFGGCIWEIDEEPKTFLVHMGFWGTPSSPQPPFMAKFSFLKKKKTCVTHPRGKNFTCFCLVILPNQVFFCGIYEESVESQKKKNISCRLCFSSSMSLHLIMKYKDQMKSRCRKEVHSELCMVSFTTTLSAILLYQEF